MIKDLLKEGVQRFLPRKYYAPIRRVQYGVPAHVARSIRPMVWRHYLRNPIPETEASTRLSVIRGHSEVRPRGPSPIPKRIWLYWDSPDRPELVAAVNSNVVAQNPDHEVVFLNRDNAAAYIPEYEHWDDVLLPQHKADLLRLYLISRFGGIWLDSSIYLGSSLQWVHDWAAQDSLDYVGFYNDELSGNDFPMLESWFLAAPPGTAFVNRWLDYTLPLGDEGIDGCYDRLKYRVACEAAAKRVPNPRVRVIYISNQAAFEDGVPCRMGLLRAKDEAFSFAERFSGNAWELAMSWTVRRAPVSRPTLLKMTQRDRSVIGAFNQAGMTHPKSLIGEVLADYRTTNSSLG